MASTFIMSIILLLPFFLIAPFASLASYAPLHGSSSSSSKSSYGVEKQLHIVYMGAISKTSTFEETVNSHVSLLSTSLEKSEIEAQSSLAVSYHKSFNGFAAKLTPREAKVLKGKRGVVSVFKSERMKLLTTRSWDFLGLNSSSPRSSVESDLVIGLIDTGIWPENPMFDDTGFGPIPSSWKGACIPGDKFTIHNCNRKLIGAKYFKKGIEASTGPLSNTTDIISARDSDGHGSHTSTTAAGSMVKGASLYGLAKGDARGGVPSARIAMYKACWLFGCDGSDILSAFDEALHDGVDVLSISIGNLFPVSYDIDPIAIGAFHAMQMGIVVTCAAGNTGIAIPTTNMAPWIITVAASSIDRQFYSQITLGNNITIKGTAINTFVMKDDWYPLISGEQGTFENTSSDLNYCDNGALDSKKVEGKIVYCDVGFLGGADESVLEANGTGLIYNVIDNSVAFPFALSTSALDSSQAQQVYQYINTTSEPVAKILPCEVSTNEFAPLLAYFSSRGPNIFTPTIMKPDLSAPGVDILAAWSRNDSVTEYPPNIDPRITNYNIISGTSMATPHAAGAAAYVKSMHPLWSPAAIKSALMTTATPFDKTKVANKDLELGYGAGQINPTKAVDPGLIYDVSYIDYVNFLCERGYNSTTVALITGDSNTTCPQETNTPDTLNYPAVMGAFTVDFKNDWYNTTRTLTNVGHPSNLTYVAVLEVPPQGMEVMVSPQTLSFTTFNEKQSFTVAVQAPGLGIGPIPTTILSTTLVWTSDTYSVRTPIVAYLLSY